MLVAQDYSYFRLPKRPALTLYLDVVALAPCNPKTGASLLRDDGSIGLL